MNIAHTNLFISFFILSLFDVSLLFLVLSVEICVTALAMQSEVSVALSLSYGHINTTIRKPCWRECAY